MLCESCGSNIPDGLTNCPNCGSVVYPSPSNYNNYSGYPNNPNTNYGGYPNNLNTNYGGYSNAPNTNYGGYPNNPNTNYGGYPNTNYGGYPNNPSYPQSLFGDTTMSMKWYKFISYVALPLAVLMNFANSISLLNGLDYGENKELIYNTFDGLQSLDTVYGGFLLLLALFTGFVCFSMINKKNVAPLLLYILQIAIILSYVIYLVTLKFILNRQLWDLTDIISVAEITSQLITRVVIFIANFFYFQKRRHLFIY